jgi:hypothetical protein
MKALSKINLARLCKNTRERVFVESQGFSIGFIQVVKTRFGFSKDGPKII